MSDTNVIPITDPYETPVIFVNSVVGSGSLNGVVNITFATARFTPSASSTIDPDLVVSARLRMDFHCVRELHATLGRMLEQANGTTKAN